MSEVKLSISVKHWMSQLSDLKPDVAIDRAAKQVTLDVDCVDSALICDAVTRVLPDHDVVAYTDETEGWAPAAAPFRLRIRFAGELYGAKVVRLFSGNLTLHVEPMPIEKLGFTRSDEP